MSAIKALLSDSDGTLVDTVNLIRHGQFEAAHEYLTRHGIPDESLPDYSTYEDALHKVLGGRTRDTIEETVKLLYQAQPHHLNGVDFDELYALLDPIQDRLAPEYIKPYPGLAETLTHLGTSGIMLAIISSGDQRMIVRNIGIALPELGLTTLYLDTSKSNQAKMDIFERTVKETFGLPGFTVVTSDDTTKHKPDPEAPNLAMRRLGVGPHESAGLGDHRIDMRTFINAGIDRRIGVTHGFDDRVELEAAGATNIIDSFAELPAILLA